MCEVCHGRGTTQDGSRPCQACDGGFRHPVSTAHDILAARCRLLQSRLDAIADLYELRDIDDYAELLEHLHAYRHQAQLAITAAGADRMAEADRHVVTRNELYRLQRHVKGLLNMARGPYSDAEVVQALVRTAEAQTRPTDAQGDL